VMDDIRKMVEDVCREDDASRRDFELWEWRRDPSLRPVVAAPVSAHRSYARCLPVLTALPAACTNTGGMGSVG
jgi:hypothetical protein